MKKIAIAATTLALIASTIAGTPAANAATVPASKATVLAECSKIGEVAKGRGADGSDLKCGTATVGSMQGKKVWLYPTLPALASVDVVIPNKLTSGFGGFGRAIADALKAEGLSKTEPVLTEKALTYNLTLDYFNKELAGQAGKLGVTGFAQVSGAYTTRSATRPSAGVGAARMMAEYEAIAVKADSKYTTIESLIADLKANPKGMTIVGGNVGGIDNYTAAQLFDALNLGIGQMSYVANQGKVPASLLSDAKYAFGISGYADFAPFVKAGTLRILAVTSPKKLADVAAPTLVSKKLDVVVENWRGIMLPPGTSKTKGRNLVIRALDVVTHSKSFKDYLVSQTAFSNFLPGDDFQGWLKSNEAGIKKLLINVGLL